MHKLHLGDLPSHVTFNNSVAIDTEAMGLLNLRDRLCVVQISSENQEVHLVKFEPGNFNAPNLTSLLKDPTITKIFHFARFDIAIMKHYLGVMVENLYCTKIASRLARTYTDSHGLKDLCNELLGVKISKQQQSSDWGATNLTQEQIHYAASDVLHLHHLKEKLDVMLLRENRMEIAKSCFKFLPTRAELDLLGWNNFDIFSH